MAFDILRQAQEPSSGNGPQMPHLPPKQGKLSLQGRCLSSVPELVEGCRRPLYEVLRTSAVFLSDPDDLIFDTSGQHLMRINSMNPQLDLTRCENEPVHIPKSIQPHGILFVLDQHLVILQVSDNVSSILGKSPEHLLNQPLTILFSKIQLAPLLEVLHKSDILFPLHPLHLEFHGQSFHGLIHPNEQVLILELEPVLDLGDPEGFSSQKTEKFLDSFDQVVRCMMAGFQKITHLPELLHHATQEIRKLLKFSRVMVYQLDAYWNGCVVAEDKQDHIVPFLNLHYPASDFPPQVRELYARHRLCLIVNVEAHPSLLIPTSHSFLGKPLDFSLVALSSVASDYIEYLKNMGVKASLSFALFKDEELWGLVICYHDSPHFVGYKMRHLCELMGHMISMQISLLTKQHEKECALALKTYQSELLTAFSAYEEDLVIILAHHHAALLGLVNAQGVVIVLNYQYILLGKVPSPSQIKNLIEWLRSSVHDPLFHTESLPSLHPPAFEYKHLGCGLLALSMAHSSPDYILWFRPELIETIEWAGDPRRPITLEENQKMSPRRSFETWKQIVSLKSSPWQATELDYASVLINLRHIVAREKIQSELRQAKKAAEKAYRAKSTFLANISHELRTPLHAILGYTQLIKQNKKCTSLYPTELEIIDRNSDYLLTLINDVLELSRIEAEKIDLYPSNFHLAPFLYEIIDLFRMRAEQKKISFIYEKIPPYPPISQGGKDLPEMIYADQRRLRQILLNLLSNAIQFTQHGRVNFKVGYEKSLRGPQGIRFQIEDTGIGIHPEAIQDIFLPFKQLNDKDAPPSEGTGIGLAITKKLIEMMGGSLHVKSHPGKGSTFWTILDFPEVTGITSTPRASHSIVGFQTTSRRKTCKILVVDDKEENRLLLEKLLSPLGFEVKEAIHGQECVNIAKHWLPDLILIDLIMPVMDGFEAMRQIRKIDFLNQIPIILLSASTFDDPQQQSFDAGCDDFLPKPFRIEVLLEKLKKHLKLTWIYEEVQQNQENKIAHEMNTMVLVGPSRKQASILLNLAMQGDIHGIIEYAQQLEQSEKQLLPFAQRIKQLADDLQDEKICQIVKQYL